MDIKYNVKTEVKDGYISQTITQEKIDGMLFVISTTIANTREKQFEKALIKLGWTPPNDRQKTTTKLSEFIRTTCKRIVKYCR